MAKPAAKRVKVEKGAVSEPAPTEAPAAAPVKEEKKPARPKTAAEVAHEREVEARTAPYKGRALFARRYDMLPVMGGSSQQTYCRIGGRYPRRAGQEFICCSYTFGAGLPLAAGLDGVAGFGWDDGSVRPIFVRRSGYAAELCNDQYGPHDGTAPNATGGTTNGWEYCGEYRIEEDDEDLVAGTLLSSLSEPVQQHWLDHWARTGRSYLVDAFKNNPDTFILENTDRLVFDHYDEQLYKDLKAHQDARVAEM